VFIEELRARHFRNLKPLQLKLSPKTVVLSGDNGTGKTNLLEALYVCATGRSFRRATAAQMLPHSAQADRLPVDSADPSSGRAPENTARLYGRFSRAAVKHEVEIIISARKRAIRADGRKLGSTIGLLELLNVVAFFPDDLAVVKGSPEGRRRFLDRAVASSNADFVAAALAYQRLLRSRNAMLKSQKPMDPLMRDTLDEQLADAGARVHLGRLATLAAMAPVAQNNFAIIAGAPTGKASTQAGLVMGVALKSGFLPPAEDTNPDLMVGDLTETRDQLLGGLRTAWPRDRAARVTTVGPHRADLCLTVNGHNARDFASQGQQRAMVLSLKLAELGHVENSVGCPPILLLDDVSSELDKTRNRHFFDVISAHQGQVWVSTTGLVDLPLPDDAQVLSISDGEIVDGNPGQIAY